MSEKSPTLVLIGPSASGKSTLAPLLAQQLGLEHVQLDEIRWRYYDEIGFDHAHAAKLSRAGNSVAMYHTDSDKFSKVIHESAPSLEGPG